MAFTEKYSNNGGSGLADGSSEANAWDLPDGLTNIAAGQRLNHKGDVTIGADAFTNAGTVSAPIVLRAYNATIGDLDDLGRDATGDLVTTNFPTLTLTGVLTMNTHCILQNFIITGALSSQLVGDTAVDQWGMINCRIINTQNNANASCVYADDVCRFINCDFECSGASHNRLIICDILCEFDHCRFKTAAATNCIECSHPIVQRSVFWGNASSIGIDIDTALDVNRPLNIDACTFYGIGTAIRTPNALPTTALSVSHCHVTDCAKFIDNLYSATANITVLQTRNRTRDVTTLLTGVESIGEGSNITTDDGDASTDYVDAANGDFHLISTAAGYAAGLMGQDIGAEQHDVPSSGGGLLRPVALTGGLT